VVIAFGFALLFTGRVPQTPAEDKERPGALSDTSPASGGAGSLPPAADDPSVEHPA
jgi:hypothetical protein